MRTAGQFLQDSPSTDGQIFVFPSIQGFNTIIQNLGGPNFDIYATFTSASATAYYWTTLPQMNRIGLAPNYQEQFGTAALQPGPSSVAGTSDPLNLVGMPPVKKSSLATLTGGSSGFVAKGYRLDYVDVIYQVTTNAISGAGLGIWAATHTNNGVRNRTPLLTWGANGLPSAVQANPYVTRVIPTVSNFIITPDTIVYVHGSIASTASAPVVNFYGLVLGISYNFN